MKLKKLKYLTLRDAARHFETSIDILCDWMLENTVRIEAKSNYDNDNFHPLNEETWRPLLASADKKIKRIVFNYPKEIKKFRLNGSRFDDQKISRSELRISMKEIERIMDAVVSDIGGVLVESYGVKKVRRAARKWPKLHKAIITAANDSLREMPTKFVKSNGALIISRLAKYIDENRKQWIDLADEPYGTSVRNIRDRISELKDQVKIPVKRT